MKNTDSFLLEKDQIRHEPYAEILIVDDDPNIQRILKDVLERKDIPCETASSAEEALSFIETTPSIKLALLDIIMPEISGIDLLKRIQAITPSVHVIMITGALDVGLAEECMKLGAKDYMRKPFDMEYLETSVLSEILPST